MWVSLRLGLILASFCLATSAVTQSDEQAIEGLPEIGPLPNSNYAEGGPQTTGQFLERHGVELTNQALIAALLDPRPDVRSVVAEALAERKLRNAIPALEAAATAERAIGTRVVMAGSLAAFKQPLGSEILLQICSTAGNPSLARMMASQYLFALDDERCLSDDVRLIRSEGDNSRQDAEAENRITYGLSSVQNLRRVPNDQLGAVRSLASSYLRYRASGIRVLASHILGIFGDASSLDDLQKALASENDPDIKAKISFDIALIESSRQIPRDGRLPG